MLRYQLRLILFSFFFLGQVKLAEAQDINSQCQIDRPQVPVHTTTSKSVQDIIIKAKKTSATLGKEAHFDDDVFFHRGDKTITADHATYNQKTQILKAKGQLVFKDKQITFTADTIEAHLNSNQAELNQTKYWLNEQNIHGDSQNILIHDKNHIVMNQASLSTCPDDSRVWNFQSTEIYLDQELGWVDLWGSTIEFYGVPIFYFPYFTAPISNKRKSGFLRPAFDTNITNGFIAETPIYWDISPNYDATFTPSIMSTRGTLLKGEFRYLYDYQRGALKAEQINNDRIYEANKQRYALHFQNQTHSSSHFKSSLNYSYVSDNEYFLDLPSDIASKGTTQLNRYLEVGYYDKSWDLSILGQDIKVLHRGITPYQVIPQMMFNYRAHEIAQLIDFDFYNENTVFQKPGSEDKITRLHLEPSLTMPLIYPEGSFITEVKLLYTYYQQQEQNQTAYISRKIPQFKTVGQLNFERYSTFFDLPYRQTLEPKIQYLYVDYINQDQIGLYDTAELSLDYASLFRERKYSGLDRISNANQITVSLGTGFFNQYEQEKMYLSLGQIFYFQKNEVSLLPNNHAAAKTSRSSFAINFRMNPVNNWYFHTDLLMTEKEFNTEQLSSALDYRTAKNQYVQLNYRYKPDGNPNKKISQAGVRAVLPLTESINTVGNYYYDLIHSRAVDSFLGIEYESCCWGVRLGYYHQLERKYAANGQLETLGTMDHGMTFSFFLPGIAKSSSLPDFVAKKGLFNYNKPIYIND